VSGGLRAPLLAQFFFFFSLLLWCGADMLVFDLFAGPTCFRAEESQAFEEPGPSWCGCCRSSPSSILGPA